MSVVKLAVAGAAIYASGGLLAAGATGWLGLAAGATLVGGAATALGTLNGDKKLAETGGYLMLAGGLGQMAVGKMAATGADAAGNAADSASAAQPVTEQAAQVASSPPAIPSAGPLKIDPSSSVIPDNTQLLSAQRSGNIGLINRPQVIGADTAATTGPMDWIKNNPTSAMMIGQTVSGLATGLATSDAAAQAAEQARLDREAGIMRFNRSQYSV